MITKCLLAAAATSAMLAAPAHADEARDGAVTVVFEEAVANLPGKSLVGIEVAYPPGGASPAHHHASTAFIMAYVVSGDLQSQVEGEPAHIYHAGQTWHEDPGAHHLVSRNISSTKPAKLLAVVLVDSDEVPMITTYDLTAGGTDNHDE